MNSTFQYIDIESRVFVSWVWVIINAIMNSLYCNWENLQNGKNTYIGYTYKEWADGFVGPQFLFPESWLFIGLVLGFYSLVPCFNCSMVNHLLSSFFASKHGIIMWVFEINFLKRILHNLDWTTHLEHHNLSIMCRFKIFEMWEL